MPAVCITLCVTAAFRAADFRNCSFRKAPNENEMVIIGHGVRLLTLEFEQITSSLVFATKALALTLNMQNISFIYAHTARKDTSANNAMQMTQMATCARYTAFWYSMRLAWLCKLR